MPEIENGPALVLYNKETGGYENIPAAQAQSALASGKYYSTGATETVGGGEPIARDVSTIGAAGVQGERAAIEAGVEAQADSITKTQRELAEGAGNRALTFGEGVVDALSFGMLEFRDVVGLGYGQAAYDLMGQMEEAGAFHTRGEAAKTRRDVYSGTYTAGQITGFVVGLATPGSAGFAVGKVTTGGVKAGRAAAEAVLGARAESAAGKIAVRAMEEAGAGAALGGAASFGHQMSDVIIEDKEFSGQAMVSEMGFGAVVGLGVGGLSGILSNSVARAARKDIQAQGGLSNPASPESLGLKGQFSEVRGALDGAVEQHAQRLGVLQVLAREGHISDAFLDSRAVALKEAQKAAEALKKFDFDRAMAGNAKEYQRFRAAIERYETAAAKLDDAMSPQVYERIKPQGDMARVADDVFDMDTGIYRPARDGLGRGKVTPTSEKGTIQGKKAAQVAEDVAEEAVPQIADEGTAVGKRPKAAAEAIGKIDDGYKPPSLPGPNDKFNLADFSDNTLAGELGQGRVLSPRNPVGEDVGDLLNNQAMGSELMQLPDGYMMPARDAAQNAQAFAQFRQKAADTAVSMPKNLPVSRGPKTEVRGTRVMESHDLTKPFARVDDVADDIGHADTQMAEGLGDDVTRVYKGERAAGAPSSTGPEVQKYLDEWFAESKMAGGRVRPGDAVAVKIQEVMDDMMAMSKGKLDSVGSLELGRFMGLDAAATPLGERLDQVWSLRKAAEMAAKEAQGIKTPLRQSGHSWVANAIVRRFGDKIGAMVGGGLVGGAVGGLPGYLIGAGAANALMGNSAKIAASAGRVHQAVIKAADTLLKGRRATVVSRTIADNHAYEYSDAGPIKDPIKRIEEIHRLAQNPDEVRSRVRRNLGDLPVVDPELATVIEDTAIAQITGISMSAPAIAYGPLGDPLKPSEQRMRAFHEYENAVNDISVVLNAVANGSVTRNQIKALQVSAPAVYAKLVGQLIGDPAVLKRLDEAKRRAVEMCTGVPLTRAMQDPTSIIRAQSGWKQPGMEQPTATKPQALKITPEAPTPAQSGARAPGN